MRKSRFSLEQKAEIVRQRESGAALQDLCCQHKIATATFYMWRRNLPKWEAERKQEQQFQAFLR